MAKFVEVHVGGESLLLNLDKVEAIIPMHQGKTVVQFYDSEMEVSESYEEVKQLIDAAQGGIPMEPGRMYDEA